MALSEFISETHYFVPLQSQNGLLINSELLRKGDSRELKDCDKIDFVASKPEDMISYVFRSYATVHVSRRKKEFDETRRLMCQNWVDSLDSGVENRIESTPKHGKLRKLNGHNVGPCEGNKLRGK